MAGEILRPSDSSQEPIQIEGHSFEIRNVKSTRHVRFISSTGWTFSHDERLPEDLEGMTPEEIAGSRHAIHHDAYYEFTRVEGELTVDGTKSTTSFKHEVDLSPRTYIKGEIIKIADFVEVKGWKEGASKLLEKGFEKAVLVRWSKDRPFSAKMYGLNPGDRLVKPQVPTEV